MVFKLDESNVLPEIPNKIVCSRISWGGGQSGPLWAFAMLAAAGIYPVRVVDDWMREASEVFLWSEAFDEVDRHCVVPEVTFEVIQDNAGSTFYINERQVGRADGERWALEPTE